MTLMINCISILHFTIHYMNKLVFDNLLLKYFRQDDGMN